jgi:hypothetical protein
LPSSSSSKFFSTVSGWCSAIIRDCVNVILIQIRLEIPFIYNNIFVSLFLQLSNYRELVA